MLQRNGGDSFLLPMTLAEVSILLFFLLLFVAFNQIREVESEAQRSSAAAEKLQSKLQESRAKVSKLETYISETKNLSERQIRTMMEKLERKKKMKKLREKVASLKNQVRGLDSLATLREQQTDEEFKELVRSASQNIGREKKIERLTERLEEARADLDSTRSALGDYKAQSLNLSRRLKEAGQGYPPCWAGEDGNPQYIYTVRLLGDSLQVRPNWPPGREGDVQTIPGAFELAGRRVSRSMFAELADPILEWSRQQSPECRHFVVIKDSKKTTKEEFKNEMFLVERFFYKYIDR